MLFLLDEVKLTVRSLAVGSQKHVALFHSGASGPVFNHLLVSSCLNLNPR